MVWLFERGNEIVRLETLRDTDGAYVLITRWAEGPPETERYADYGEYEARVIALEKQLTSESWTQLGDPEILPVGWLGPIPH